MESKSLRKAFIPILLIFIFVNSFVLLSQNWLGKKGVDSMVLIGGNLLLFIITIVTFILYKRALVHPTTAGFLRNVYSGLLIKLFACAAAAFIYISFTNGNVNKPALFGFFFLYLLYTFIEMRSVMNISRQLKKNV